MTRIARLALIIGLALASRPVAAQDRPARASRVAMIEFLDVGQGDAILIRSPEGKTALIDAGPHKELAAELLRRRGVRSLDLLVLSHHHADHYGGMEEVVRQFRPRVFLDSGSSHTTSHYLRLLELVRDRGIVTMGPAERPRRIELGSVVLTVFPRAPENPADENENSVGIRLRYGSFSALLPGDAERSERAWWEREVPDLCADATVLKLAHHGSNNGTDARWLGLVRPELAVACVGRDNEYGHPGSATLALLARSDIPLLRTDRDGSIVVESDGRRWWVVGRKLAARAPPSGKPRTRPRRDVAVSPARRRININRATQAELETLPGVGPVIARRIIEGRPYHSVEELDRVKEIGPRRLEEMRPYVTVD
jgi:beta-lactamase superfamily II metal-dependent hydrolase